MILFFGSLWHQILHLLGDTFWMALVFIYSHHIRKLPNCGGFFMR
jgi:hypothetical protein